MSLSLCRRSVWQTGWIVGTQTVPAQTTSAAQLAIQWSNQHEYDGPPYSTIKGVAQRAEAIAVITVNGIDGPLWNSADGQPWLGNSSEAPLVYSVVHANVDDVWIGSVADSSLDIYTPGHAMQRYESAVIPPMTTISGGFEVGGQYIVALGHNVFPFETGDRIEWNLAADFFGNWRLNGTQAVDGYSPLSASIDALRAGLGCHAGQCSIGGSMA